MRTALQLVAGALAFVGLVVWLFGGPNLGWTKTALAREQIDDVTGIAQIVWEKTFLPGVDFVGATTLAALALWGASFLARRRSPQA